MNTTSLREFLTLAKTLSFSNAAKELFISQSVLTRHIRELEKEFGAELFLRTTHEVALTEAGRILAGKAPGLLQKCDSAQTACEAITCPPPAPSGWVWGWNSPIPPTSSTISGSL